MELTNCILKVLLIEFTKELSLISKIGNGVMQCAKMTFWYCNLQMSFTWNEAANSILTGNCGHSSQRSEECSKYFHGECV